MSKLVKAFFALALCLAPAPRAAAQAARAARWQDDPELGRRVEALLKQMTPEEKVGQLNQYSYGMPTGPGTGRSNVEEAVRRGEVGSFLNVTDPALSNRLQRLAMEESRLKIPIIFGLDVIHGYRTIFPVPLALSATWDAALV